MIYIVNEYVLCSCPDQDSSGHFLAIMQVGEPALSILFYIVCYNSKYLSTTGFNGNNDFEIKPKFFQPTDLIRLVQAQLS